jgi:epsilon-lactone hydrolase
MKRIIAACAVAVASFGAPSMAAEPLQVGASGETLIPAFTMPGSSLASREANDSRVEHILTERALKAQGKSLDEVNAALFGPRLDRMLAAYPVTMRNEIMGGVKVTVFEPKGGVKAANRDKVLINLHGGGFVGCFTECGGLESAPIAALTGIKVISVDYRLAPAAKVPEASEDAAAVYRDVLKHASAQHVGIFGCSAGGSLTLQSLSYFQLQKLPRPAAAGIYCAGGSFGGDSSILGAMLGDGDPPAPPRAQTVPTTGYARGAPLDDPVAYPARHPEILAQFPPTLVIVGTRDFALSGAVALHSQLVANGVDARLHVWEGVRHAFFYDSRMPESKEAYQVMTRFFVQRLR